MADTPLFARMPTDEIAELEHATGLLIADQDRWSAVDYDTVIAYFRRKALTPAVFTPRPTRTWFSYCMPARD